MGNCQGRRAKGKGDAFINDGMDEACLSGLSQLVCLVYGSGILTGLTMKEGKRWERKKLYAKEYRYEKEHDDIPLIKVDRGPLVL